MIFTTYLVELLLDNTDILVGKVFKQQYNWLGFKLSTELSAPTFISSIARNGTVRVHEVCHKLQANCSHDNQAHRVSNINIIELSGGSHTLKQQIYTLNTH